ncbi:beta-carotene ketolase CrtW [Microseira sp. BLCC-F43]|uniref:beta-carotene ketolase CrtW n=1 Tax=Microseira sp. BLCC-F43 TaxID=3153602 RepID=UPI0035B82975
MQSIKFTSVSVDEESIKGLAIAVSIISLWAISLIFLLSVALSQVPIFWIGVGLVLQTFLYTGLFITAHDAMHGVVYPKDPRINNFVGSLALLVYGLFSYKELLKKHHLHHRFPSSEKDPDFHDLKHKDFFRWYLYFMKNYWSWTRLMGLNLIFIILAIQIPIANIALFWIIPSLLSSVQLFYFGTFLTHQEPEEGYTNPHRAKSTSFPVWWSFITCYNFGYHEEHHQYPNVPWWKLPEVRERHNC